MEIKIACACGTKYSFEVEPVHGRMPAPVNCPACAADGTAQANEFIRTVHAPAAPAKVSPAPPPPLSPGGGLHINRPGPVVGQAPPPFPPNPPTLVVTTPPEKSKGALAGVATILVILICFGFGAWKIGGKWYKRVKSVVAIATSADKDSNATPAHQNFWYEDNVVLFIKHTNHMNVAQACQEYWKGKLHRNLTMAPADPAGFEKGEYGVVQEHNGFVRIIGGLDWTQPEYEGLALHLSQQFDTLVFEVREVDFSGAYHFGVYERGVRKFHAQMDVKIQNNDAEETVTTEGNDWAIANGYKPGPDGFKEFHLGDADEITQRLGMKLWDEPEGEEPKMVTLKE